MTGARLTLQQKQRAAELYAAGASERDVADELGCSSSSAHRIRERLDAESHGAHEGDGEPASSSREPGGITRAEPADGARMQREESASADAETVDPATSDQGTSPALERLCAELREAEAARAAVVARTGDILRAAGAAVAEAARAVIEARAAERDADEAVSRVASDAATRAREAGEPAPQPAPQPDSTWPCPPPGFPTPIAWGQLRMAAELGDAEFAAQALGALNGWLPPDPPPVAMTAGGAVPPGTAR